MKVIVTGASKGIGKELVKLFLKNDHQVLALSRDLEKLKALRTEANHPENLRIVQFDITMFPKQELLDIIVDGDQVDILINNAASLISKPFSELSTQEWRSLFEVNLFGPARLIRELIPKMERSDHAHIVNIGSMGGFQGSSKFPGLSAYSSSKAALANLTECLAEELKEKNIAVNCLCLGAVNTEMLRTAFPDYQAPLQAEEMASFIYNFAVNNHKFMNGKVLPVSLSTP